jgi:cellobiose phosphorylase
MDAAEKYLSDPLGTVISYPAYTKYDGGIGGVTLKHAGIHENGGVYLHTIAWKIAADAMLKRADKVEQGIETILPFRNKVVDGRAEPYIMCNSYFGKQTGYRYGTPGQSWRTAAGQWFLKSMVNYVFGLLPELEGLKVDPCLPPSWKNPEITKSFRGTTYRIKYENGGTRVKSIIVDGKAIEGNILPLTGKETEVLVITE